MMIYRYSVDVFNKWFELPIADRSKILSFQYHERLQKLCVWAVPSGVCENGDKRLIAVGTHVDFATIGMDGSEQYIATAQMDGFVWHLFEKNYDK